MKLTTGFRRRDAAHVQPWAETCGQIRPLLEEKDGASAEVHHLEITDAKLHYHQRTDEIYYVLDGQGQMQLDGQEIELHGGVVVYVPRGVKHKAWGNLKVLVVCIPPGVLNDVNELEYRRRLLLGTRSRFGIPGHALAITLSCSSLLGADSLAREFSITSR